MVLNHTQSVPLFYLETTFQLFPADSLLMPLITWQGNNAGCCDLFLAACRGIQKFRTGIAISQE